jgi:DNA-binding MarR family transcriptional regulator
MSSAHKSNKRCLSLNGLSSAIGARQGSGGVTLEEQMSTLQASSERLTSWVAFLRAHSAITRQLNADLLAAHGLTLSDYEVLLRLSRAEHGMMRRVDLAESVVLTASGITRLLDGLERCGLVEKAACSADARVSYAKLTDAGRQRLREAASTHLAGIDELFTSRFTRDELESLAELLERLPLSGKACFGERSCAE